MVSEPSPVEFTRLGTVPKTPLQRIMEEPRPTMHTINTEPTTSHTLTGSTLQAQTSATINVSRPTIRSRRMEHPIPPPPAQQNAQNTQNDLADLIILQQRQASLPSREIPVFNGDLLSYCPFIQAFEH